MRPNHHRTPFSSQSLAEFHCLYNKALEQLSFYEDFKSNGRKIIPQGNIKRAMLDGFFINEDHMELFRAVPEKGFEDNQKKERYATRRLPGNIPYLVDNLWELARPDWAPSRRYAAYASPTKELALQNASAGSLERDQYIVCRLTFKYAPAMIQLSVPDAREHNDVGHLQKFVNSKLVTWADTSVASKLEMAPLFLPGITKEELTAAMDRNAFLNDLASEAKAKVTLWTEYPANASPNGEFFFEMASDNAYWLHKV